MVYISKFLFPQFASHFDREDLKEFFLRLGSTIFTKFAAMKCHYMIGKKGTSNRVDRISQQINRK